MSKVILNSSYNEYILYKQFFPKIHKHLLNLGYRIEILIYIFGKFLYFCFHNVFIVF